MEDLLKLFCKELNIHLIYTNNKYTVLSNGFFYGIPQIRAHNIFKKCDKEVARAIIEYYSKMDDKGLMVIEEYLIKNKIKYFKIVEPVQIANQIINNPVSKERTLKDTAEKSGGRTEAKIKEIMMTDMSGNEIETVSNDTIKPLKDDFYELDITIDYKNT